MPKFDPQLIQMCTRQEDYPNHNINEIVLVGRSNVGKSTFINKIFGRKKLAYTSVKPGKTQTINFYLLNDDLCFVDVPGYGYAKVSKKKREEFGKMIEVYLLNRKNLISAILLIDFKVGPTEDDLLMYNFLKYCNLKVYVICTKKDKVKKNLINKQKNNIISKLQLEDGDILNVYSSENSVDINNIRNVILNEKNRD